MNLSITSSGNNENHLVSNTSSTGISAKRRKLSMGEMSSTNIELEILRSTIEKWKQYAQKLEAEKLQHIDECHEEKIMELEDTVKKLQSINAELLAKNEQEKGQNKTEMDFVKNEYETKIKTMENEIRESREKYTEFKRKIRPEAIEFENRIEVLKNEKQKFESKIKELSDEIASMKNIKIEPKDSDENQREIFHSENGKLKAEINDLKKQITTLENKKQEQETEIQELADEIATMKEIENEIKDSVENEKEALQAEIKKLKDTNHVLETKSQEAESMHLNSEKKKLKIKKKYDEATVTNQQLEQTCKELEETITKNKKKYQTTKDRLKTENQELKSRIEILENNEHEEIVSLDEAFNGSKLDLSLLSCKTNIIMNVAKLEGISPEVWKLYSTLNESEKPRLLTEKDMMNTCFKMNITDQFMVSKPGPNFHDIMRKINTCKLKKLHLKFVTMDLPDFIKLVSSKKVQICILYSCTVVKERNKECEMDELLMHLPNITEFKYHSHHLIKNFSSIAKNLGKLDPFPNLQKFEISYFWDALSIEDMKCFIKKNNKDISYVFKFTVHQKALKSKIKSSEKDLMKALPIPYNIKLFVSLKKKSEFF